ncbi:MAG: 3-dehydroquinate synthase [candidate division WOR-3 bacterium]
MSENIILTGFMGSGKDTIGRLLASRLNMGFISTDQMIEFAEQKPIKGIFEERGEVYFRKKEKWVIEKIKGLKNVVIATGGGMVIDMKSRKELQKMGTVVQLSTNIENLKKRIISNGERPLIRNVFDIDKLYREREGIYDFAEIKIDNSDKKPETVVNEIIEKLNLEKTQSYKEKAEIRIKTKLKTYPVIIGYNITERLPIFNNKVVIITNPLVGALYMNEIINNLRKGNNEIDYFIIPDGEEFKNFEVVKKIYEFLFQNNFQRKNFILSLGGGVITDIAGFVASTFKRGCRIIHIPTTLLCQVDAAIGGKTGINTDYGKNMVGTFYQPELVLCDLKKLLTLSDKEFFNGIAEVIKYSVIHSKRLFNILQRKKEQVKNRNLQILFEIMKMCVSIKGAIINQDETEEKGIREILNFGHTVGHIIETVTNYNIYSHGEAISMGMVEEMRLFGRKTKGIGEVKELLKAYDLPIYVPCDLKNKMKKLISHDKKMKGKYITIPVFEGIGKIKIKEVLCRKFF